MNDDSKIAVGDIVEVETQRLARGGKAVGRSPDGRVLFVSGAAPGELVRAEVTALEKRFGEGELIEVLRPSLKRVQPPCEVVNLCGGCPWQHIEYKEQVIQKEAILRDTLTRGRAIPQGTTPEYLPYIPSDLEFGYRSRVTLQMRTKGSSFEIGYLKRASHDFVAINSCLIADPALVPFAREHVAKSLATGTKIKDRFQVTLSDDGKLSVGGAFTQVNRGQNLKLQKIVAAHVLGTVAKQSDILHWHLLDLYCGNGNLTFPTIESVRAEFPSVVMEATGVEASAESIRSAQLNPRAQLCRFYAEDVEHWLMRQKSGAAGQLTKKGLPLDEIVVLDPPRDGVSGGVMQKIARRKPSTIVFVSCDPATQTRDLVRLQEATAKTPYRYEVESVQGIDMFPQTDHIESIVVLRRKAN